MTLSKVQQRAHIFGMSCGVAAAAVTPPVGIILGPIFLIAIDRRVIDWMLWAGICQFFGGLALGNLMVLIYRSLRNNGDHKNSWKPVWAGLATGTLLGLLAWMYFHAGFPELNTSRYDGDEGWLLYQEDSWVYWGANAARVIFVAALPVSLGLWIRLLTRQGLSPRHPEAFPGAFLTWIGTTSLIAVITIPRDLWYLSRGPYDHARWWIGNLLPNGGLVTSLWWWIAPPLWLGSILLGAQLLRRERRTEVPPGPERHRH